MKKLLIIAFLSFSSLATGAVIKGDDGDGGEYFVYDIYCKFGENRIDLLWAEQTDILFEDVPPGHDTYYVPPRTASAVWISQDCCNWRWATHADVYVTRFLPFPPFRQTFFGFTHRCE